MTFSRSMVWLNVNAHTVYSIRVQAFFVIWYIQLQYCNTVLCTYIVKHGTRTFFRSYHLASPALYRTVRTLTRYTFAYFNDYSTYSLLYLSSVPPVLFVLLFAVVVLANWSDLLWFSQNRRQVRLRSKRSIFAIVSYNSSTYIRKPFGSGSNQCIHLIVNG